MHDAGGGVEWVQRLFHLEPRWTVEPDLNAVHCVVLQHVNTGTSSSAEVTVAFYAQGGFNKLYSVQNGKSSFILRVSLPVEPRYKTLSEVATINYVRLTTDIPTPAMIAFDDTRDNGLGFEWMLMTKIPYKPLADLWFSLRWEAKVALVNQVADHLAQLYRLKSSQIGNLYESKHLGAMESPELRCPGFVVGQIVSTDFMGYEKSRKGVSRGPFVSSRDWLKARLAFIRNSCLYIRDNSEDEDDVEDAEDALELAEELIALLPAVFPETDHRETFALHHDDVSAHNILVDESGQLQGLVDWECVSFLPLFKTCDYPSFLDDMGADILKQPNPDDYFRDEDGNVNSLYFEHLQRYEKKLLRDVFLRRMESQAPQWIAVFRNPQFRRQADFEFAVMHCNSPLAFNFIKRWLQALKLEGEYKPIKDFIPN